jgi:hypothetical protein
MFIVRYEQTVKLPDEDKEALPYLLHNQPVQQDMFIYVFLVDVNIYRTYVLLIVDHLFWICPHSRTCVSA